MLENGVLDSKRTGGKEVDPNVLSKEEIIDKLKTQEKYIRGLETQLHQLQSKQDRSELIKLKESEEKLKEECSELKRREQILIQKLTFKDRELQETLHLLDQLKTQQSQQSVTQIRSMMLDPAVNVLFEKMTKELKETKDKLEQSQNDLQALKFTPDSQTGKRLMARIRQLHQENVELGESISSGALAKLQSEISLGKTLIDEMKKSEAEHEDFIAELDEETETLQSTIVILQAQLREANGRVEVLENQLRSGGGLTASGSYLSASGYSNTTGTPGAMDTSDNLQTSEQTTHSNVIPQQPPWLQVNRTTPATTAGLS